MPSKPESDEKIKVRPSDIEINEQGGVDITNSRLDDALKRAPKEAPKGKPQAARPGTDRNCSTISVNAAQCPTKPPKKE